MDLKELNSKMTENLTRGYIKRIQLLEERLWEIESVLFKVLHENEKLKGMLDEKTKSS